MALHGKGPNAMTTLIIAMHVTAMQAKKLSRAKR